MNRLFKTTLCSGVALAAMAASVPAISQEITSSIRGTVTTPAGNAAAGYTVVITDTRTGSTQTTTTNSNGSFSVRSLTVGGPYTIRVSGGQYEDVLVTDVFTQLGNTSSFNLALSEAQGGIEEIVVVASAASVTNLAIGPGTAFNLADIQNVPSVSRQIRDVIRIDPRVNIGRGSGGQGFGISCLGGSNRTNSFTIDGVRAADPFGLNASGNLARNTFPIPFDTVSATSVEFSPVDVEYGQFTGCNINIVTKSGTNEFTGSAFLLYAGDNFTGEDIEGQNPVTADFDNYNWGVELGGPVIEDKIFFYGSYEETDAGGVQDEGPIGGGFLNESGLTADEAERVRNILINQYDRDPGEIVRSLPQTSRRFFGRIDWQINDQHRFEASYARLEENQVLGDDISGGRGEFTFQDNFQDRGSISDTYSFRLFSNWTENFSTEIRASRNSIGDVQSPTLGGEAQDANPIPRIAIGPFGNEFFGQDFASGPGVFRSANQLDTEIDQFKFKADYVTGDHLITVGYELDSLDVFNLFIINATGTILFDDIDALEAGTARAIRGNGSFTGNARDAAAEFQRDIHTIYIQDEWQVTDTFNLVGGLRYDFYKSGDQPILNPAFQSRYGFANTQAFDGLDVFQPRIGFTWELPEGFGQTTLTGGFARFSGGDPTVWFANSFQNFGGAIGFGDATAGDGGICTDADLQVLQNGQFTGIPACVAAEQQLEAALFGGEVAATDPDFKVPSQDRFSLGISHYTADTGVDFFDDWQVNVDFIYGKNRNAVDFVDLSIAATGELAPDGRPIYARINPTADGCGASLNDDLRGYSGLSDACFTGGFRQNIILTNAADGRNGDNYSLSAQFAKTFDFSDTASLDFRAGYAFADANVGNPGTSSTAGSNFEEVSVSDFNNVRVANSTFTNKHNIVVAATFKEDFFDDLTTSLGVFFRARSGRPLSFVFDAPTSRNTFGDSDDEARSLLYIPTGPDDPLVDLSGIDSDAFFAFIDENNLNQFAGGIVPRTTFEQPWTADIDLRFQQELPGFGLTDKDQFLLFIDFENVLNFIDSGAGVQRFVNTSNTGEGIDVVGADIVDGRFVYNNLVTDADGRVNAINEDIDSGDTLWRIQFGIKYRF